MLDVTENTDDLDFTKFFAAAVAAQDAPDADPPATKTPATKTPVVETPVVETPVVETPVVETPVVETPVAQAPDFSKLISDTVAATAAALKPEASPPGEDPELAAAAEALTKFRTDWPEHAAVMDLALKAQQEAMTAKFQELLAPLQSQLVPMQENAEAQAQALHESTILKAHADAVEILPKVEAWVAAKPAYLQDSYNRVLDTGSAADVVALFSDFKKETGAVAAPPAAKQDTKRISTTEPIQSLRDVAPTIVDPNDFEGAFKAAAAEAQRVISKHLM
jgi:hypothetical protein